MRTQEKIFWLFAVYVSPVIMIAIAVALAVLMLSGCAPAPAKAVAQFSPAPAVGTATPARIVCTVTAEALHLRSEPSPSAAIITWLKRGDQLTTDQPLERWIAVTTSTGKAGYINSKFCEEK
jgi:hypothetical protein